jgi:hypothetical protein
MTRFALLALVGERVEVVAKVRDVLNQHTIIAITEFEDIGAAVPSAGIPVTRLKVSDEFRVFLPALRTDQGNAGILGRADGPAVGSVG